MASGYNIFRWYRAGWGRYTQADPIGLRGGINVFAYVEDLPTGQIDPMGLSKSSEDPEDMDCCQLHKLIEENSRELKRKAWEERDIQYRLRNGIFERSNLSNMFQYWRHWREFNKIQRRLKDLLDEYNGRPCQPEIPKQWAEWSTNEFPDDAYLWDLYGNRIKDNWTKFLRTAGNNAPKPQQIGAPPPPIWWIYGM